MSVLDLVKPLNQRVIKPFGPKVAKFARRPVEYDAPINILEGAVRSAKTWGLHFKILDASAMPITKGERLLFGATKTTIKNNVLNDLFNIVGEGNYGYNAQSGEMDIFGARWRVVGAKDEGSEKAIRGSTIAIAVGDELVLIPRSFFMMLRTRMSVAMPRLYGSTNPDTPFHYIKTELLDNAAMRQAGDLWSEHFELSDNPNLEPPNYREQLERQFPPGSLYHQRFVLGLWVTGEGAIYKDVWSDALLYDDEPWTMSNGKPGLVAPKRLRTPREGHVERYVPVDCGVDHPQVYLDMLDDGTNIWVDREYVWDSKEMGRQKTDGQYRADLEEFLKSAPGAQVIVPPECASFEAELALAGIWFCIADNEVLDGIKTVSSMMALGRLRFHRRCKRTIAGLQTHCWDPKASVRGEEQPLKVKDDEADAVRYGVKTKIAQWRLLS